MFMVSCIVLGLTKPRHIKMESGSAPQFFDAETPPKSTRKLTHPVVPTWRFMGVIGRVAIHVTYYNPYWGTYNPFIATHEPLCRAVNNSEYGFQGKLYLTYNWNPLLPLKISLELQTIRERNTKPQTLRSVM